MSVSENYIPQSENLEHFNRIVEELQQITNENSQLKAGILTRVDSLIKQLNQGRSDNISVIKRLNKFISEVNGEQVDESISEVHDEKEQLLAQNEKLKSILANKIEYNEDLEALNAEYQENIDTIMYEIRERRFRNDETSIANYNNVQKQLELLQDEEFNTYLKVIKNQQTLSQIYTTLSGILRNLTENTENDVEIHKLLSTLELYKTGFSPIKPKFSVKNFQTAKVFIPSSLNNDWPGWRDS